ncbi:MAG: hypothetical protein HYU71_05230 [Bacteroidetes bacterium]|nr:hypothetical protein [Bacteroidota bacterium]
MNEQVNQKNAAFMEVTSHKVEVQDQRIMVVEENLSQVKADTEALKRLSEEISEFHSDLKDMKTMPQKIEQLSTRLGVTLELLQQPVPGKVIHHHYIPKLIWIAAGLFLILCMVCMGWYNTNGKLNGYLANDTKYRQLRLDTSQRSLQRYMDRLDSLYEVSPDMREKVIATEDERKVNFERLQKAERLKAEAKVLEKAAGKNSTLQ